jgi:hypothetical protein
VGLERAAGKELPLPSERFPSKPLLNPVLVPKAYQRVSIRCGLRLRAFRMKTVQRPACIRSGARPTLDMH